LTSRLDGDHAANNWPINTKTGRGWGGKAMSQIMNRWAMAAAAAGLVFTLAGGASAAEITLLCSNALKSVVEELGPQFEKATGHKLKTEYGSTGPLKAQIEKGQAFDVAILGVEAI